MEFFQLRYLNIQNDLYTNNHFIAFSKSVEEIKNKVTYPKKG